jgi:hypothetical protein
MCLHDEQTLWVGPEALFRTDVSDRKTSAIDFALSKLFSPVNLNRKLCPFARCSTSRDAGVPPYVSMSAK